MKILLLLPMAGLFSSNSVFSQERKTKEEPDTVPVKILLLPNIAFTAKSAEQLCKKFDFAAVKNAGIACEQKNIIL